MTRRPLGQPWTAAQILLIATMSCVLVSACARRGDAKTLYVDGGAGNDATSYTDNGPARPWRTIGRAAWGSSDRARPDAGQAAQAGDTVRIAAGRYATGGNQTGGGGGRFDVAYNPVNEGTAGRPIRFESSGPVELVYSSGAGPMIGSNERDYIEWSGFTISEGTAPTRPDTGPVTFFNVTGGSIEHSTLTGNPNMTARNGDNYNGVRLEDARGVRIAHNRIADYGGQTNDRNHAGIETYRAFPLLIENNEIVNCGSGIYLKAVKPDGSGIDTVTVRFNVFRGSRWGINVLQQPMTEAKPLLVYQNIFVGQREAGFWINMFDHRVQDARWVRFFNNTLIDNVAAMASFDAGVWPADSRFLFWNNIVSGGGHAVRQDTTDVALNNTKDRNDFDRNVYHGVKSFGDLGGASRGFGEWRRLKQDANSITADPGFRGPTDYRLKPDSPARAVGRALHGVGGPDGTTVPAGAYITGSETIGPAVDTGR